MENRADSPFLKSSDRYGLLCGYTSVTVNHMSFVSSTSKGPIRSPHPLIVVALGTSFTARGVWSPVSSALEAHHRRPVRIVNAGRGGANSRYGVEMTPQLAELRPDFVLVEFAGNDADIRAVLSLTRSGRNIRTILDGFLATVPDARIFLVVTHEFTGPRGWLRPFLNAYNERHKFVALCAGVNVIDLRRVWRSVPTTTRDHILPDGVHLTADGFARVVAPAIVEAFTFTLQRS
jgi:acyl-CoA thioesterase-1